MLAVRFIMENIQRVILGQDILLSINSKEPTKFKVIKSDNGLISLVAHHIGDDDIYSLTLRLIPPMPPEGMSENER